MSKQILEAVKNLESQINELKDLIKGDNSKELPSAPNTERKNIISQAKELVKQATEEGFEFTKAVLSDGTIIFSSVNSVKHGNTIKRKASSYIFQENEVINTDIANAIIYCKMKSLNCERFINAPRPNLRAYRAIVEKDGRRLEIAKKYVHGATCDFDSEFARGGTIVNDTYAEY